MSEGSGCVMCIIGYLRIRELQSKIDGETLLRGFWVLILLYAEERSLKLLQIGVQQVFIERIMYIKLNTFISI